MKTRVTRLYLVSVARSTGAYDTVST